MNKRLVWNFEISGEHEELDFSALSDSNADTCRFEARYFWNENDTIVLHGLNDSFLNLVSYKAKERHDSYYLLSGVDYNIKRRRDELLYKPLLKATPRSQGFGKKINIATMPPSQILTGISSRTAEEMVALVKSEGEIIVVDKMALIYKLPTNPTIKIELSRLCILKKNYFSLCIEGLSESLVMHISNAIVTDKTPSNYVHFLKEIRHND